MSFRQASTLCLLVILVFLLMTLSFLVGSDFATGRSAVVKENEQSPGGSAILLVNPGNSATTPVLSLIPSPIPTPRSLPLPGYVERPIDGQADAPDESPRVPNIDGSTALANLGDTGLGTELFDTEVTLPSTEPAASTTVTPSGPQAPDFVISPHANAITILGESVVINQAITSPPGGWGTPGPMVLPVASASPVPGQGTDPSPTTTPLPMSSPTPAALPVPVSTAVPTPTPTPVSLPVPSPTATPEPTLTSTPQPTPTPTQRPTATPTPTPYPTNTGVAIECIFYDGLVERSEADEYVQIKNGGRQIIDLKAWRLEDLGPRGPEFEFPDSYELAPGKRIRVYTNQVHREWGGFSFGRRTAIWRNDENNPDSAGLFDPSGRLVSEESYPPGCGE